MYSYKRASQLLDIPAQRLYSWTLSRQKKESEANHPVVHLELPDIDGEHALSFLNLIELKLLNEFRRLGLSLQYIRQVVDVLAQSYDIDHPLACKRLMTDGQAIFAEIDESGEFACIEIAGQRPNHVVMEKVIRPFFREIDFLSDTDLAYRWFPGGREGIIVLDSEKALGEPILINSRIRTLTLATLYRAGDTIDDISSYYEIPRHDVMVAVEFENRLLGRAA